MLITHNNNITVIIFSESRLNALIRLYAATMYNNIKPIRLHYNNSHTRYGERETIW